MCNSQQSKISSVSNKFALFWGWAVFMVTNNLCKGSLCFDNLSLLYKKKALCEAVPLYYGLEGELAFGAEPFENWNCFLKPSQSLRWSILIESWRGMSALDSTLSKSSCWNPGLSPWSQLGLLIKLRVLHPQRLVPLPSFTRDSALGLCAAPCCTAVEAHAGVFSLRIPAPVQLDIQTVL